MRDNGGMDAPRCSFDALDVLARAGDARDAFCSHVGGHGDDIGLIRALLGSGSGSSDRAAVDALVELAAVVRALEAFATGRVDLDELRSGMRLRSRVTRSFERLGPARAMLRTVDDLLVDKELDQRRVAAQLRVLHGHLHDSLRAQLTGCDHEPGVDVSSDATDKAVPADGSNESPLDVDDALAERFDALARECAEGPPNYRGGGLRAFAWVRGWIAVPVASEQLGDDPAELERVARVLESVGATHVVRVERTPRSRYEVAGTSVTVGSNMRRSREFEPTIDDLRRASGGTRRHCVFTTRNEDLVYVEDDDHHVIAGPRELVEAICGCSVGEALGAFHEHVEALAVDDEPPEELAELARAYGRMRRRR